LDRYEREVLPTKAAKTQTDQRNQIKQLAAVFGKMEPGQIKPVHIAGFLDAHPSPYSANRCIALLSHVYTKALRWGLAESNPCRGVERNPEKPSGRLVTEEEFWRAWEIAPPHVQLLMELALVTGQRLGDLVRIKWADVRDDGVYFKQAKTGKRLVVGYSPSLRSVLARAKSGVGRQHPGEDADVERLPDRAHH
jgi:integrase